MTHAIIEDRRIDPQISLTVLTHMEERLTYHAAQMEKKFDEHTADEMDRYNEILSLIAQSNTDHNKRHEVLLQSVESHMNKTEHIYECFVQAFPQDKKGRPDFAGHAMAHEEWMEGAAATKELMAYIKKAIAVSIIIAVGSWIGMLVWQGVLHGPKL